MAKLYEMVLGTHNYHITRHHICQRIPSLMLLTCFLRWQCPYNRRVITPIIGFFKDNRSCVSFLSGAFRCLACPDIAPSLPLFPVKKLIHFSCKNWSSSPVIVESIKPATAFRPKNLVSDPWRVSALVF